MKFKINNDEWEIEEKDKNELKELYEKETQEKTYFVFGVTVKSKHIIYINKDMCQEQKIRTLKHDINKIDFNNKNIFKVENYKYLQENPKELIIYALAILIGEYHIERKRASLLLLKALIRKDFLSFLLENPNLYPIKRSDSRVINWSRKIKEKGFCEKCGSKERLEAHHILEWSEYPKGRIDINNGMCLCLKCHTEEHKFDKSYCMMRAKTK